MASLMDYIMNGYYAKNPAGAPTSGAQYGDLSGFSPFPSGGEPLRQAGAGILAGQLGAPAQMPASPAVPQPMPNPFRNNLPDDALGGTPSMMPQQQSPFGTLPQFTPMPQGGDALRQAGANMVMQQAAADVGLPVSNIPMPPSRPSLPGRTPGFLDQILSGPDYQSNNMPVDVRAQGPAMQGQEMPIQAINWGDAQNPADFFRADQLLTQNPNIPGFLGGY